MMTHGKKLVYSAVYCTLGARMALISRQAPPFPLQFMAGSCQAEVITMKWLGIKSVNTEKIPFPFEK